MTDEALLTAGEVISSDPNLKAAREGRAIYRDSALFTPGAAESIRTDSEIVFNLEPNTRVMITQAIFTLQTVSDDCVFEIVSCTDINGGGVATRRSYRRFNTGATLYGRGFEDVYQPPIVVRWKEGARSITIRVDANDAACQITVSWRGWWEPE